MIKGNILKKYKKAKITKIQIILFTFLYDLLCNHSFLGVLISMINYRIIQNSYKGEKIYQQNINTLTARNIAVVPGTAVSEDTPNAKCKERLDTAELLYKKKLVTAILVSGTKKRKRMSCADICSVIRFQKNVFFVMRQEFLLMKRSLGLQRNCQGKQFIFVHRNYMRQDHNFS